MRIRAVLAIGALVLSAACTPATPTTPSEFGAANFNTNPPSPPPPGGTGNGDG